MSVLEITKDTFEAEVINSDIPVLVDFYASWCGPCRMLAPVIDQIANEVTDIKVAKVNIDDEPELASSFDVMSVPSLFVFKGGKVVNQALGALPKQRILALLK